MRVSDIKVNLSGSMILQGISFEAKKGETLGIIGPNGSGKTTLFNVISGFVRQAGGSIELDGECIEELPAFIRAQKGIGRVFQSGGVFGELTVLENLIITGKKVDYEKYLQDVGLDKNKLSSFLSGGQKRILELIRAQIMEPKVLLLDEPTAGVAPNMKQVLADKINSLKTKDRVVLIIEHDIQFISSLCDRILVLHQGQIVMSGKPEEIRKDPYLQEIYFG